MTERYVKTRFYNVFEDTKTGKYVVKWQRGGIRRQSDPFDEIIQAALYSDRKRHWYSQKMNRTIISEERLSQTT